ncbi:uncharacterized protein I303_102261 [Kwoniella dejecticola CBS 10117]|uniref:Uncharacterized protein n=1 Tax=Kwoniella dejecticola CBS 10117 TaxID=1296121 RepID=A0A1A6ABG1_9TREE|nr:uncharacterized protein I303_01599 [Kwoniella dejecticola CBS 10117]OBR87397.1 hypothetical protein I303_01599 [Kwoniella dejecticola CBS 10117]
MSGQQSTAGWMHCRWDFCLETFSTFAEWELHFVVEHIAHAKPIELVGRVLRKRDRLGEWDLVDNAPRAIDQLPLDAHPSQTTGDITTTTHTLSFPMPPSFHSLPDPLVAEPPIFLSDQKNDCPEQGDETNRDEQDLENDRRLYQSFLRSPSPAHGESGSGSGSGIGSMPPPPPGQRPRTPPWTPSYTQSTAASQEQSQTGSEFVSGSSSNPSHPTASASYPHESCPQMTSPPRPSQPSTHSVSTPSHSGSTSSGRSGQQNAESAGTRSAAKLRFGAALGAGEAGSSFAETPSRPGSRNGGVGFDWAGAA